jgi:glycosyl transferase family 2
VSFPVVDQASYVLPLRSDEPPTPELVEYLRGLSTSMAVIVIDGSPAEVFRDNRRRWGEFVLHLPVVSETPNGKVAGVLDGVAKATTPLVLIADDDVRYDQEALTRVVQALAEYDAVVPQNYFRPLPWHARWDSARSLVNRAFGHDYAGTIAVRRAAIVAVGGYCGAVLFENLELMRTLTAGGYRVHHARDIFVPRRPPSVRHFLGQRVRQAFDSSAQPGRQALELLALPLLVLAGAADPRLLVGLTLLLIAVAERGRRIQDGQRVFPWHLSAWAPAWAFERSVCAWLAVIARARGGVGYAGRQLSVSAHSAGRLHPPACPASDGCRCWTPLRPALTESDR